ncbi:CGNR zinc finger domain-containing protein [Dactylosporangium sp. NPDC051485]|uniref:CGNR zinc finger domain-containing protein n=1 Tax=Dactylosporangium sp. NPDC051485 TaxID=3154846 RepID=UPI0034465935
MQFNPYGGTGAFLAAELLNAPALTAPALVRALSGLEMTTHDVDESHAAALAAWIERARPVFGEPDEHRQIALVNGLLAEATTSVRVSNHDGKAPHLHYTAAIDDPVERIRSAIAGGLAVAVCGAGGSRLGRCGRPGCGVVYVDTSRNGRRRFCTTTCANRINVAAHRARAALR